MDGGLRMKLVPLEDRVLVKVLEQEEMTKTGIVLPDTAKEKPSKGKVVAVGPGKYSEKGDLLPMPVKEGDIVVFAKYAGTEVKLDGEEYLVLRGMTDLIGILPEG
jgi:chaperonin GroES